MSSRDDKDYHSERARAEIDLAYRADTQVAAEAHLKLSALHMARLGKGPGKRRPPTVN